MQMRNEMALNIGNIFKMGGATKTGGKIATKSVIKGAHPERQFNLMSLCPLELIPSG